MGAVPSSVKKQQATESRPCGLPAAPLAQGAGYEHSRTLRIRSRRLSGTLMARELVPGQRGQQASGAGVMSGTAGTIVIMVGAILLFALSGGSPSWLNLQVVGIILIVSGVLGLAVPSIARSRGGWFRRWVVPM